jgi:replicative DNA helicase
MNGKGLPSHRIDVSDHDDVERFLRAVGALGHRRERPQAEILIRMRSSKSKTNRDTIPKEAWRSLVLPAMLSAGVAPHARHPSTGVALCGSALYDSGLTRERALRIAEVVECDDLHCLATSDVYWDEILSIEPDGVEDVYDLTVEGLHSFVANDVIAHNSLEQDADIVIFIYRDEYYEAESDQQGLAEVHIAKHRNGPTDTVKLSFLRRYAKFADLAA